VCATCGCAGTGVRVSGPGATHSPFRTVDLEADLLAGNDALATRNRDAFAAAGIVTLNLMSSPGSGKTTLLERTARDLSALRPIAVLEGDQETHLDAERIRATGVRAVQINTGAGCHLDAAMVDAGVRELAPERGALLFVENVGNLVCPALFDLGERARVVIMSVTEGADKPLKYPHLFRTADLLLVNKIDLLPYVDFDVTACVANARRARPGLPVLQLSATTGAGLDAWYGWLNDLT
jgi:hydrogenase nickel incorporation protein HypB